jgi:predicted permease
MPRLDTLRANISFALRLMQKRPAFTALVVATLALGIGANTAIFTLADAILLRPLPYRAPEQLHLLWLKTPPEGGVAGVERMPWSFRQLETLRRSARGFSGVAGVSDLDVTLTGDAVPERLGAEIVTSNYFDVLGVSAARGRTFERDYQPGAAPFVVISAALWASHFGASPAVIGRTVVLNGSALNVIGVAPAGFKGTTGRAELWIPTAMAPQFLYDGILEEDGNHWLQAIGRTDPAVERAAVPGLVAAAGRAVLDAHRGGGGSQWQAYAVPFRDARQDPVIRRSVLVLLGAVAAVLLIVCVNVANLLLARATQREHEVAVRLALGAPRKDLAAQLLTESVVLAVAGLVAGLLVALWGVDLLAGLTPERTAALGLVAGGIEPGQLGLNWRVLAYAGVVTVLTGVLFGAVPALQMTRSQATVLRAATQGEAPRGWLRGLPGARGALVITEIALALVLLTAASLMLRSFVSLRAVELGFDPDNVLTFRVEAPAPTYTSAQARLLQERILDRIATLPNVTAVGADVCPPLQSCMTSVVNRAGDQHWDFAAGNAGPQVGVHATTPKYFAALRVPVRRGRVFDGTERPGGPLVAVLNEAAAARLFPGRDPVGQRLSVMSAYFQGGGEPAEVIGVVGDVRYEAPDEPGENLHVYTPAYQFSLRAMTVMVRTSGKPEALIPVVREAVSAEAPELPIYNVRTMRERVADATARTRFATLLLGIFAAISLVLAAVGIYGVTSFMVTQRTRELGIRVALGARRSEVLGLVLRQGGALILIGSCLGLGASLLTSGVLRGLLFEVTPNDPLTMALGLGALVLVALLAVLVPAWSVLRQDPVDSLRTS